MRRPIAGILTLAALAFPQVAHANTGNTTTCQEKAGITYTLSHWRSKPPTHLLRGCPAGAYIRKLKERYFLYRHYRQIATNPGFSGEGKWLEWLVIPRWVVAAETNGYHGEGRWQAQNPSGACGPYQLLGHTSCDTSSARDKVRHHEVAASLPRGSWAVGY